MDRLEMYGIFLSRVLRGSDVQVRFGRAGLHRAHQLLFSV